MKGTSLNRVRATVLALLFLLMLAAAPAAVASNPTVAAVNTFPVVQGQSGPVGDITITESTPSQLTVGDVITYRFEDSASAATLHFATAGTVSGTNGLAATVTVASSSGSLDDEMQVTITSASTGTFPGVLTLSGLTAAVDVSAATGSNKVLVSDAAATLGAPTTVADANMIATAALRAPYTAQSTPTILPTASSQTVGNVTITEPAKSFFHAGDVITLSLRDTNGSADTVGLGATPYAAGGSMTVSVAGANGGSVQQNDTAFLVDIVSGDASQGSASTITISNIVVDTAEAPLGPVTLSAVVTSGPDVGTALIVPGRVSVANVGGNTTTTAAGAPTLALNTNAQPAGNVSIAATAGSLQANDTITLTLQTPGVTFTEATPPIATVTSGSLVLSNATATLNGSDTVATWTVSNGDVTASTIVIGPIYYDIGGGATGGQSVSLLASGEAGSAFTSQVVSNAKLLGTPTIGSFSTDPTSLPSENGSPFNGADVTYREAGAGSTPVGSSLVLISPYATQIAAYRTTFASVPSAQGTSGLTLGTPTVNHSAMVVATASGSITAPAQTVAIFPVTAASTGSPSTVTFSGLVFNVGNLVPPGTLITTGVVEASGGVTSASAGNQVVDLIDTHDLGTSSATTPPVASLTQMPPAITNRTSATFAYTSNEAGSTFACALDGAIVSLNCPSPITLPGLSNGQHTFTVQAFNSAGFQSDPVNYTWTIDTVAPTATVTAPSALSGPVLVTFSEPVEFINSSTVTLVQNAGATPTSVPATLTCTTQAGATHACSDTSFYTKVSVQPPSAVLPGQHLTLTLNPALVSPAISDQAGNPLATRTAAYRPGLVQDQNSPAATPAWATVKAASASGGSYSEDHLAGASVSYAFTGTAVTWHTVTGPNQGDASLYVDNVLKASVKNYSKSIKYKVARTISGLSSGPHVLRIVVSGRKGSAAATDTQVAVDDITVGTSVTQQSDPGVSYSWAPAIAAPASGGAYATDDLAGARYSFAFRGTGVKWMTVLGPTMGQASVYVDGVLKGTFNNYASKLTYQASHAISGLTDASHTLQIVVLGKRSAAATGSRVAVDGFVVS